MLMVIRLLVYLYSNQKVDHCLFIFFATCMVNKDEYKMCSLADVSRPLQEPILFQKVALFSLAIYLSIFVQVW